MRALFNRRSISSQTFKFLQTKPFCNTPKNPTTTNNKNVNVVGESNSLTKYDAYKEVQNLDFMKAAKILFSDPPKKKEFGLDFHLVQLFFVCLPSLAVYLVALYARREMRRMDVELEQKKRTEEEAKAKEMELKSAEEAAAAAANPELFDVKVRLEKLEETVKDIVVETKKQSNNSEDKSKLEKSKQEITPTKPNNSLDSKDSSNASTTNTSSNAEGDASTGDLDSQSKGSSPKKI